MKAYSDADLLKMALLGYEREADGIQAKIAELHKALGAPSRRLGLALRAAAAPQATRRRLSPAARKRIAAAQKKRWARYHDAQAKAAGA